MDYKITSVPDVRKARPHGCPPHQRDRSGPQLQAGSKVKHQQARRQVLQGAAATAVGSALAQVATATQAEANRVPASSARRASR
ncbi:hypothetical protein GCM10007977_055770 [Dactylosporangium sucinum]|uniref:Uncharacterized protein n=1 Tax=Dactylosporangium sucinum TaxID=1424081 RepID=A0A917TZT5_9ACTN|nr:hypothetical protein GCM10007977_055770 [Dactylosporangium sucinum]